MDAPVKLCVLVPVPEQEWKAATKAEGWTSAHSPSQKKSKSAFAFYPETLTFAARYKI